MNNYSIKRFWEKGGSKLIKSGLTLEEAQAHCKDPETSSRTATEGVGNEGNWFDGYEQKKPYGYKNKLGDAADLGTLIKIL